MSGLVAMLRALVEVSTASVGTVIGLPAVAIFSVSRGRFRHRIERLTSFRLDYAAIFFLLFWLCFGLVYLAYPNYLDHLESTVAVLGQVLARGASLYPMPDLYPYHGILYGPALAEIQEGFQWPGINAVFASKLPGVIAFASGIAVLLRLNPQRYSRGYLLYLAPSSLMLFWNRAEPFLILLVSIGLLAGQAPALKKHRPLLLGILAGAASALKLHGAIYVLSAYLALTLTEAITFPALLIFGIAAAVSFLAFFIPGDVSLVSFIGYIKLAGHHGLDLALWVENLSYLLFLWIPVLAVALATEGDTTIRRHTAFILVIELLMTVVGAKPGSGPHHLLPFIPVNAFLIHRLQPLASLPADRLIHFTYATLIVPGVLSIIALAPPMIRHWPDFSAAQADIMRFQVEYPDLVMGISDAKQYPYTYLRPLLHAPQIDFPAFMDLRFAGIRDDDFAGQLDNCELAHVLLPNLGRPFSIANRYNEEPLLSDHVRNAFAAHYALENTGKTLSVYRCHPTARE